MRRLNTLRVSKRSRFWIGVNKDRRRLIIKAYCKHYLKSDLKRKKWEREGNGDA